MVSALDSGWSGLGSSPGRGYCLMFLGKTLYSHSATLYPGVQIIPANMLGVTLRWKSIPSGGSTNTPSCFMLKETGAKRRPHGLLGTV